MADEQDIVGRERTEAERLANLPENLRRLITPDALKGAEEDQRRWAEVAAPDSPYLSLAPQMAAMRRAARELPDWRESREIVARALEAADLTDGQRQTLARQFNHYSTLLADAYALLGEFELAAALHPDKQRRAEYERIVRAIERPDTEECGADCAEKFAAMPHLVTREYVEREVFSLPHGGHMSMVVCGVCGGANVKPLPDDLVKQRGARARARALTEQARTKEQAAEILERNKLTSEQVFK